MDDERLKNLGGGGYWTELLQRIRDIRASEKVFYRQVLNKLGLPRLSNKLFLGRFSIPFVLSL